MAQINLNITAETPEELNEILSGLTITSTVTGVNPVDPHIEKKAEKKPKKKTSTEKTSGESPSSNEPEKSATQGKHPNASKKDVQAAMKKAMNDGHREAVKTAFGRFNAEKLSDLKEEDYSAFLTDLEALVGE
ncbi:hypothetical protein [Enterococcus sp. CSURQ0835]|uniref:hypothetical protein n=1 Tax=Enterococcus sp. CSURQ0835 TaxID=2681394 RepID=UPI001356A877|nr:hypothetical protein [Enterococcus sp. CSURQ0835]